MKLTTVLPMLVFSLVLEPAVWAEKVIVVLSRSLPPYEEAWQGFSQATGLEASKMNMEGDPEKGQQCMRDAIGQGANLVVTVGSEAALAAKKSLTGVPVVYTMVLEKQDFGGMPASGVLMQADTASQIRGLRQLFPGCKKIGVIYNIHYSGGVINQARQNAESMGLSLSPIAVENQGDIATALSKLTRDQIDVLWSVVDPTVAQPECMQMLIEHTLKEKIPFIALSKYHVKGGALAAFSVDYRDMGVQTAELAKEMLKSPRNRPVEMPRHLILFVNPDTQEKIGLKALPQIAGIQIVTE